MQPRPWAETTRPSRPSVRVFISTSISGTVRAGRWWRSRSPPTPNRAGRHAPSEPGGAERSAGGLAARARHREADGVGAGAQVARADMEAAGGARGDRPGLRQSADAVRTAHQV